jgi:uncharacterized metal-binding protein YceD (DUF177 family)
VRITGKRIVAKANFNNIQYQLVKACPGLKNNRNSALIIGLFPYLCIPKIKLKMSRRRDFEIAFVGLKPGVHEFNYSIDDSFFEAFQQQDFTKCKAQVKLSFDKKTGFMLLKFEVGGVLEVNCDRCNSRLPLELWDEFNITVKMVDEPEVMNKQEDDPDVYYIGRQESHLDVANWIYEFINLSIPMQKVCNFEKMDGPHCNPEARETLKKLETEEEVEKQNPIWKGLEKFKDLEN